MAKRARKKHERIVICVSIRECTNKIFIVDVRSQHMNKIKQKTIECDKFIWQLKAFVGSRKWGDKLLIILILIGYEMLHFRPR